MLTSLILIRLISPTRLIQAPADLRSRQAGRRDHEPRQDRRQKPTAGVGRAPGRPPPPAARPPRSTVCRRGGVYAPPPLGPKPRGGGGFRGGRWRACCCRGCPLPG